MCLILKIQPTVNFVLSFNLAELNFSTWYLVKKHPHIFGDKPEAAVAVAHYPLGWKVFAPKLIDGWCDLHVRNAAAHSICFTYFGVTTSHAACGWLIIPALNR